MATNIQINMLGKFEVIVNNERVDHQLSKSKKGWTIIKYLLLHMNRDVPYNELYETLWPNEESTNPENALKTLVSRMRAFLEACSPELGRCIITNRGAYRWNSAIDCRVDVSEFETLCKKVSGTTSLDASKTKIFNRIVDLYAGDLLQGNSQEAWTSGRSVALHNSFIKIVSLYLDLLKEAKHYDDVIRVSRSALEIDAFEERFHMDLMDSLVKVDRDNEAMAQYNHAKSMHFRYMGVQPPEGIQAFYKQMIEADSALDMDIDRIRTALRDQNEDDGAFVCDYTVFKEIYNLQMRYLERTGATVFIALIMVSTADGTPMEPMRLDEIMRNLLTVLVGNLRRGDTVTHNTASQYALLLPNVNYDTGRMVMERVKVAFYRLYPSSSIICNYRIGPINL